MSIQNIYIDNIHNCIVYMLSYYQINFNPKISFFYNKNPFILQRT